MKRKSSLKSQIIISITGLVFLSLAITTVFFGQYAKNELSEALEINALSFAESTKNNVESQYNSILFNNNAVLARRKIELKNNIEISLAVLSSIYQEFSSGQISEAAAKRKAISTFMQIRYNDGIGYFWINDTTRPYPVMIMHPTIPELDGTILDKPEFNCALGVNENLFKAFVDVCSENGEGYVDYLWPKPTLEGLTEQQPKISYVKLFEPWNWIIGTGVYIDDIERDTHERLDAVIEDLQRLNTIQRISESGYFFIFDEDNFVLVHPNLAGTYITDLLNPSTGQSIANELKVAALSSDHILEYLWDKPGFEGQYRYPKKTYTSYYEPLGWYISSSFYIDDFNEKTSTLVRTMLLFSAGFIILALLISSIIIKNIINPLNLLIQSIRKSDEDGIPLESIPQTNVAELEILSNTMNRMIGSICKSRQELKSQRDFFYGVIMDSPYIICRLTSEGVTNFINPVGEMITGYKKEEIIGKNWWKLFYPDMEYSQVEKLYEILSEGEAVDNEMALTACDGEQKNIIWNSLTRRDENNRIIEILGFGNDITDKKKIETALRQSERRSRALLKAIPDLMFIINRDGVFTDYETFNKPLYTPNDFHGKKVEEILPSDIAAMTREKVIQTLETGKIQIYVYSLDDTRGNPLFFEARMVPAEEDSAMVIVRDITKQKQQEAELHNLRNYLSNIIDSMPSVLVGVDAANKVTLWNTMAEHSTKISSNSAKGKILSEVFPQIAPLMEKISESIRVKEVRSEQKKSRITNGGTVYEDLTVFPLITNGVEGAVIRIDDVTDKMIMEEHIVQSEKMLSVGGLAAGMAHEINNPLAGMIQTASVMASRLGDDLDIQANVDAANSSGTSIEAVSRFMELRGIIRMIESINESGKRITEIVGNMLSFARKSTFLKASEDIISIIEKTLELASTDYNLEKNYDFKTIEVEKEFDENLPLIPCEGAKIQQVLLNLLQNGSQAMQEANTENPRFIIRAGIDSEGNMLKIEIEDNGPGIDDEIRKRVFEPFFTSKPVGKGTGLGLSVSYFIVTQNHGGEMEVESRPGSGTNFIIRLPLENTASPGK